MDVAHSWHEWLRKGLIYYIIYTYISLSMYTFKNKKNKVARYMHFMREKTAWNGPSLKEEGQCRFSNLIRDVYGRFN